MVIAQRQRTGSKGHESIFTCKAALVKVFNVIAAVDYTKSEPQGH